MFNSLSFVLLTNPYLSGAWQMFLQNMCLSLTGSSLLLDVSSARGRCVKSYWPASTLCALQTRILFWFGIIILFCACYIKPRLVLSLTFTFLYCQITLVRLLHYMWKFNVVVIGIQVKVSRTTYLDILHSFGIHIQM